MLQRLPSVPRPRFLAHWARVLLLLSRWQRIVAALGLLLTVGATYQAVHAQGVYQGQVFVVLLPPQQTHDNAFFTSRSLVITAGLVEKMINGPTSGPQPTSDGVPLSSTGVRHGWSVRLPNSGTQWVMVFKRAELNVQATGTSPDEVRATMGAVIARINEALRLRQALDGTAPVNMIRTDLSPPQPIIEYDHGSRSRAGLTALLLGLGLTIAATSRAGRLERRWAARSVGRSAARQVRRSSSATSWSVDGPMPEPEPPVGAQPHRSLV